MTRFHIRKRVVQLAGMILFFGTGLVLLLLASTFDAPETITDVSQYADILKWHDISGLTDHFPRQVPPEATEARMSFNAGYRYGGTHLQLWLRLPPGHAADIRKQYDHKALYRFQGGNRKIHRDLPGGVPTTFFRTSGTDTVKFPDSFTILVLGFDEDETADKKWGHVDTFGLAISETTSKVVYWAEAW